MRKYYAKPEAVIREETVTAEQSFAFVQNLESGLLLALKEEGYLNETQYQYARSQLGHQAAASLPKLMTGIVPK